jgi:hypothetical protein
MPAATINPALSIVLLRRMEADPQTKPLRVAVLTLRRIAASTRAKVDAYVAPVFARFEFYNDQEVQHDLKPRERITAVDRLYLSNDEPQRARFYAACEEAHAANGFPGLGDKCPALMAENAVRLAENALLSHAERHLCIPFSTAAPDIRRRAIELMTHTPTH